MSGVLCICMLYNDVRADSASFEEISSAITAGNSRELSRHFANRVELTISNNENIYSRAQAEVILKEFFNNNPPSSFRIIHQGASSKGSHYAIGNLTTVNGTFRTYLFIKSVGNGYQIHEIRFEKD